ncbi:substrate-binding domain-containing protein [Kangiella sp. HZ709]|uniref:substrate-binding domain-containing protein n=1 Tax=Kangiella sp. HZ709 TaxID=2666328 RepID=UPI0012AF76B5|nr:phosphate ABC transporter substrate-binding/OmpA family protein [Kangiella sp. HZ709]MRX28179.1 OmpA family protein [Kangiella sp. HZ709]
MRKKKSLWLPGLCLTFFSFSIHALDENSIIDAKILFDMKGSNTIGEKLAPELAEGYLRSIGANQTKTIITDTVEKTVLGQFPNGQVSAIEIKAHGSSTGFQALAQQDADIAMSSRRIKSKEIDSLSSIYGNLSDFESEYTLAVDGLAVIANPNLPLQELDTEQLAKVFSGEINNWSQLNLPDQKIRVFARDDNSGTYDTFKSLVLKRHNVKLAANAQRYESSGELSDMVYNTPGAIGFVALPYVNKTNALSISESGVALSFKPNLFTVSTEDYVLSRRLYLYLPSNNKNPHAQSFIEYIQKTQAQNIAKNIGLIPLTINDATVRFNRNYPPRYLDLIRDSKRLSVTFHFEGKDNKLDNKAKRDLDRLVKFVQENKTKGIYLFGFSEDTNNKQKDRERSNILAQNIADNLLKNGIKPRYVRGFGHKGPISSNATESGKMKNRRVEVWVPRK